MALNSYCAMLWYIPNTGPCAHVTVRTRHLSLCSCYGMYPTLVLVLKLRYIPNTGFCAHVTVHTRHRSLCSRCSSRWPSSISSSWSLYRSTWYRYVCFSLSSWALFTIAFLYLSSMSCNSFWNIHRNIHLKKGLFLKYKCGENDVKK